MTKKLCGYCGNVTEHKIQNVIIGMKTAKRDLCQECNKNNQRSDGWP